MSARLTFASLLLLFSSCGNPSADVIYTNATIWTGNPDAPAAEALAVTDGRIHAIGTDADIRALAGSATDIVDLGGAFVVPGFIDNHTHFLSGGMTLASVDLRSAATPQAFSQAMATFAADLPAGRWIEGGDWDHEAWGGELPDRSWIDADMSGVMITKGLSVGTSADVTVAFSLGVGGAVDGQVAETWLLGSNGRYTLLNPAREPFFRTIPPTGGTGTGRATYEDRVLAPKHLDALAAMAAELRSRLPGSPGVGTSGPFDVELGFKDDRIWLFQVRPFVGNSVAQSSAYLLSLSRPVPASVAVPLTSPIR